MVGEGRPRQPIVDSALWALWAKSDAGGRPHSLIGHLLDSGAIAELIWEDFLAPGVRRALDQVCGGCGRDVLVLLAGWHDLGKATPAFQMQVASLAAQAEAAGWLMPLPSIRRLRHGPSGQVIADRVLKAVGAQGYSWMLPIIAGHHGSFLAWDIGFYSRSDQQNGPPAPNSDWLRGQEHLAVHVARSFGIDIANLDLALPSRGVQLALAGYVSMADWIASSSLFPGRAADPMAADDARERARHAWQSLGLRQPGMLAQDIVPFTERFGFAPRPLQSVVAERAAGMSTPGLMVIEAPMGEGKTEAALAAIEHIARSSGCNGFAFAMPTQGTTDAMYDRCVAWATQVDQRVPVSLLHGKAMANESWRQMVEQVTLRDVCDFDEDDPYGVMPSTVTGSAAAVPAEWILGRHRGLLSPCLVGTIDQLLMAATHVKYVSLRFAGLVGKVVVIDEVHSYDVFTGEYLQQFLRWCGDAGIPVVLMSATLPPTLRRGLIEAYAGGHADSTVDGTTAGYPCVTTWSAIAGVAFAAVTAATAERAVAVQWAEPTDVEDTRAVADLVLREICKGGCVLVILNTVRRAQEVYLILADAGVDATLLHSRLTTRARAERTAQLVSELGSRPGARPRRRVVVATQVAEQSFDVDADLLITDIAPMDLLLQRIGRLHRHKRDAAQRPAHLRAARVVITGCAASDTEAPRMARAFDYVYDRVSLLRTAQAIGSGDTWAIPTDVPRLVAQAYDAERPWPVGWEATGGAAEHDRAQHARQRQECAETGLLKGTPPKIFDDGSLDQLHAATGSESNVERITVRDGEPSREVALVRWDPDRALYSTLSGRPLGATGERVSAAAIAREVLGDTVRVRERERLTDDGDVPSPLPGWTGSDLLRSMPALVLDEAGRASGRWGTATYDARIGLVIERAAQ